MKKRLLVIITFIIALFAYNDVHALTYARVTNTNAAVRSGPGTNYEKMTTLKYNDVVPLFSTALLSSEEGCEDGFYKADINGDIGYICLTNLSLSNVTIKLNSDDINLRNGPGTNYEVYKSYDKNKLLTLADTKKYEGSGCDAGWYRININSDDERYVCSSFTDSYNTKTNAIVTNIKGVELKKAASSDSETSDKLNYGQAVTVFETGTHQGDGCASGWLKVLHHAYWRYVCSDDVIRTNNVYRVNNLIGLNIRAEASSTSKKITNLSYMSYIAISNTNIK